MISRPRRFFGVNHNLNMSSAQSSSALHTLLHSKHKCNRPVLLVPLLQSSAELARDTRQHEAALLATFAAWRPDMTHSEHTPSTLGTSLSLDCWPMRNPPPLVAARHCRAMPLPRSGSMIWEAGPRDYCGRMGAVWRSARDCGVERDRQLGGHGWQRAARVGTWLFSGGRTSLPQIDGYVGLADPAVGSRVFCRCHPSLLCGLFVRPTTEALLRSFTASESDDRSVGERRIRLHIYAFSPSGTSLVCV